jgi:glyceraldehyde-3-phosphate dehydrogenase (NADP+)
MAPTIKINSPIDDSLVGEVPSLDVAAVDRALEQLKTAQPAWAAKSIKERTEVLAKLSRALVDHVDELAELLVKEVGKTPKESRDEVTRSAELIDATIEAANQSQPLTIKAEDFPNTPKGREQEVSWVPWGTVLAISPFNYPVNLSVSKIAPALAMGNVVAFKPSTQGAVVGSRMIEIFREAGLPKDVLTVITGPTKEIGDHLVAHPQVDALNLTGSEAVGRHAAKITGMIPLLMELGGNDPAVVLADADLTLAAEQIAGGAFKYAGQRCTAVKRVYVEESVADQFVTALVKARNETFATAGDPREHPVGPVISDQQADYLDDLMADVKMHQGEVKCGGSRRGRVWEATVVDRLPHTSRLVTEEQFGPILPVVRVKDAEEAITLANDSDYGLGASIFTKDAKFGHELAQRLVAGGVHVNGPDQRGPDNFLFTGHKSSGLGAQGVSFALGAMGRPKGIVSNS